jgi:hypothetical protein
LLSTGGPAALASFVDFMQKRTSRMRILSALVAIAAAATSLYGNPARADDMIMHRKPGLWRVTMTMAGAPTGMPAMSMCIDETTDAKMQQMAQSGGMPDCSKNESKRSGNQMVTDSICKIGNSTTTSHGVFTITGDTAYHMDMTTKFDPPMGGQAEHKMSQDAAWAGPCPAGVSPGDMVMPNGMKMNMGKIPGKP